MCLNKQNKWVAKDHKVLCSSFWHFKGHVGRGLVHTLNPYSFVFILIFALLSNNIIGLFGNDAHTLSTILILVLKSSDCHNAWSLRVKKTTYSFSMLVHLFFVFDTLLLIFVLALLSNHCLYFYFIKWKHHKPHFALIVLLLLISKLNPCCLS